MWCRKLLRIMTEFKGRHLGVLALIFCAWSAARISINLWPVDAVSIDRISKPVRLKPSEVKNRPSSPLLAAIATRRQCCSALATNRFPARQPSIASPPPLTTPLPVQWPASKPASPTIRPLHIFSNEPVAQHTDPPQTALRSSRRGLAIDGYAYSFWRWGQSAARAGGGLAPSGQYGGGQSGLIVTLGLTRSAPKDTPQKLALLLRTAAAHDNLRDRELAVGIRWRPRTAWPLLVSAERRFRGVGTDSFALYVAGGLDDIDLPARFKLETYGQAGVVTGANAGHFFDAQVRADRRIMATSQLPLHIGAGMWTGGQRGTARLDIGPSLRTEFPIGQTSLRLTADWRFRVKGNAAPGNGPALTLSTGF